MLNLHLDNLGGESRPTYIENYAAVDQARFTPAIRACCSSTIKWWAVSWHIVKIVIPQSSMPTSLSPSLRGGWANVWLKLEATRAHLRLGIKNFEFTSFDHYTDTRSFTKKMGGVTVQTTLLMVKPLVEHSREQGEQ